MTHQEDSVKFGTTIGYVCCVCLLVVLDRSCRMLEQVLQSIMYSDSGDSQTTDAEMVMCSSE